MDPNAAPTPSAPVSRRALSVDITQKQKVMVIGDFETGKTTLCFWLLSRLRRFIAFDPTHLFPAGPTTTHDISRAGAIFQRYGQVVYQPLGEPEDEIEGFLTFALSQANAMVYIDEPALFMDSRKTVPPLLVRLQRLGHKKGLGLMMSTHRYHGDIPAIFRIAHHWFILRCTVDTDIDELKDIVGEEAAQYIKRQPDYHFVYRSPKGDILKCPPLNLVQRKHPGSNSKPPNEQAEKPS